MMRAGALGAVLVLAGCQINVDVPGPYIYPTPPDPYDTCGAGRFQGLVGLSASELASIRLQYPMRIVRVPSSGPPVFASGGDGDRVTVALDSTDTVVAVYCS